MAVSFCWMNQAEIGALGQVLADQAVGVLVGAALPGAVRVAEADVDVQVCAEGMVQAHFPASVIGQGLA
jgi:hypothetical protein